jgi:4-hydroxybenzoate polyprenyltransferase
MHSHQIEHIKPLAPRRDAEAREPPLCVDLDGTLIRTDLLFESLLAALRADLSLFLRLPRIIARGRASLKADLAEQIELDPALLPYNDSVLSFVREERMRGRSVVLASASHRRLVEPIAQHLGLFDAVEATEGTTNLKGERKAERLVTLFGEEGFDYIGNSAADDPVWLRARQALVVGNKKPATKQAEAGASIRFPSTSPRLRDIVDAIRLYQWVKNLLVFVVLIADHRFTDVVLWTKAGLAFLAFGLCASSVYVLNDLLDLQLDRAHPRKHKRPFASGRVPLAFGLGLAPLLLVAAAILATFLPPAFGVVLAVYFVTTCAYSLWLKRKMLVDVFALASLYTLRLIAGAAAVGIPPSFWLLAFSMFLFLSLAMVKRYAELVESLNKGGEVAPGRGYRVADLEVLASLGSSSGFAAALVLGLYVNSESVMPSYRLPEAMWLLCPLLLYWVSRLWIMSRRGWMDDDPIVFSVRDRVSRIVAVVAAVVFAIAVFGPSRLLH